MTPAERLIAAADLLDKRASEATEGPWELASHLDHLSPPRTWRIEGIERWRGITNDVQFGEDEATARYIATMHPEVGKVLANWLRAEGNALNDPLDLRATSGLVNRHALALADLVLAGES